jgi:hypothetical protein
MKPLQRRRGFGGFLFAPAQASFSDNAIKLILIGRPLWRLPATQPGRLASMTSLLLLTPFRAQFGYELFQGREELDRALATHGVSNHWIPPTVFSVSQLPMLASGNPDPAACLRLAEAASTVR